MDEDKLAKIARFEDTDLPEREKLVLRYTEHLLTDPNTEVLDDGFVTDLRRYFSDAEIGELAFVILQYNFIHRYNAGIGLGAMDPHGGLTTISYAAAAKS